MLSEEPSTMVERRARSHSLIQELVITRNQMLTLFSQLAELKPFQPDEGTCEVLQEFCETLVDYTLQAHLNLYRYIEEKLEKRKKVLQLAEQIYPRILATTEMISAFNDTYEEINDKLDASHLEQNLSRLGEALATRIELEDQLIEVLTNRMPSAENVRSLNS
jgi:regulator of sigma D